MTRSLVNAAAAILLVIPVTGLARADAPKKPPIDAGAGRVAWFDITTKDMAKSKEFYGKLFDWQFTPIQGTDLVVEIVAGGTPIGDIRVAEGAISPYNGVPYIQVVDMQAACKKVQELGGKVVPGFPFNLTDRPGAVGVFADPAGHPMGLYSKTPVPAAPASK